uniref:Nuclear pore complex protein n=2 Tax=Schistocephalus solidus TaxID=70667 RepID=A0A0X3PID2_SCHSO
MDFLRMPTAHHPINRNSTRTPSAAARKPVDQLFSTKPFLTANDQVQLDISEIYNDYYKKWKENENDPLLMSNEFYALDTQFVQALQNMSSRFSAVMGDQNGRLVLEAFQLERSVWRLLHALYTDRIAQDSSLDAEEKINSTYHSEKEIANLLYKKDKELRETQIIIDWLEDRDREQIEEVAEKYECLFNESTMWENTRHMLDTVSLSEIESRKIIRDLYPDVVYSTGRALASQDASEDDRYLHYLFLCIRAGDLNRAQRLCKLRGEFWRAAAMDGWRTFHCPTFTNNEKENENRNNGVTEEQMVEGNPNRILSKMVSWWNAENPKINPHERAIYAALSGNLSALLQALKSECWDDVLWAHCCAMVESRVDAGIRSLLNCGPRTDTMSVLGEPHPVWGSEAGLGLPDSAWSYGSWSLLECFTKTETVLGWSPTEFLHRVSTSSIDGDCQTSFVQPTTKVSAMADFLGRSSTPVLESSQSSRPSDPLLLKAFFYATCRGLALGEFSDLLDTMSSIVPLLVPQPIQQILQSHITHANSAVLADSLSLNPLYCHVLRFMAHLVICLQHLEPDLPDHQFTRVLEAYIATLIAEQRLPLVAHYTACLSSPALQTQWYAAFLSGLKKPEDREQCLAYGIEAGLNLRSITRAVVRTMRYRFGQLDQEQQQQQPPSPPSDISQPRPTATSRSHPLPAYGDTQIITLVGRDVADLLTPLDRSRIAAIDWLVYDKSQRGEALVLANSLLRLFIAMRKLQAARSVLDRLPMAILDQLKLRLEAREDEEEGGGPGTNLPLWLENSVREHECLLLYLQAHEAYASWYEHLHSSRPSPPTTELGASRLLADRMAAEEAQRIYEARLDCWQHEVNLSTSSLISQLEGLLTYEYPGWLVDVCVRTNTQAAEMDDLDLTGMVGPDPDGEENGIAGLGETVHSRRLQMSVLRESCLREVVFMLVNVYRSTGRHMDCVRVADLVAEKEYGLYKLFSQRQLQDLLQLLHESMIHLQDACLDALGYAPSLKSPTS